MSCGDLRSKIFPYLFPIAKLISVFFFFSLRQKASSPSVKSFKIYSILISELQRTHCFELEKVEDLLVALLNRCALQNNQQDVFRLGKISPCLILRSSFLMNVRKITFLKILRMVEVFRVVEKIE